MSGYIDNAFSYNEEDLGLDAETKLRFVPNKKELELFKMEKLNMYKGTWMVCFVYGLSAAILLSIIFFTDWGRTYIYNKFLNNTGTLYPNQLYIVCPTLCHYEIVTGS